MTRNEAYLLMDNFGGNDPHKLMLVALVSLLVVKGVIKEDELLTTMKAVGEEIQKAWAS